MANDFSLFCTRNTGNIVCPENKSIYLVSAIGPFTGSFGAVNVQSGQTLNPCVPIKFDENINAAPNILFFYID